MSSRSYALLALITLFCLAHSTPTTGIPSARFTNPDVSIEEAPAANTIPLLTHPDPRKAVHPRLARYATLDSRRSTLGKRQSGTAEVNTIFSGVYPVLNISWGNKDGVSRQSFVSFIDTGSSDTFTIANDFQCVEMKTRKPTAQSGCGFGGLYDRTKGDFTNNTAQKFAITYFPESSTLRGSIGTAPIAVGGLTVPQQTVALVDYAEWAGDTFSTGLIGLSYPAATSVYSRSGSRLPLQYDPIFTTMTKQKIVSQAVFTLAIDRVPPGTPPSSPAGALAFGGLLPDRYYEAPFTSVAIEPVFRGAPLDSYRIATEFLYGKTNASAVSGGKFATIVDSGTAPNFIPTSSARSLNAMFTPPAVYNSTLGYYVVKCDAVAPWAAYKIGGKTMPIDPKDMIVRSINGLRGFEDTCFSAFSSREGQMIIGAVWQRGYVVAYDQGRSMLHFAARQPY